jgi:high-affinity iron transporter
MLQTFLTGLREGLEASLVIGIIVAYLVKIGRADRLSAIWAGVAMACALSLAVGALLTFTSNSLTFEAQETFGGVMSIFAVALVTSMVFWMKRNSHRMKGELHGKLDAAMQLGWWSLALMAFITVGREGLETALFLWPTIEASGSGVSPVLGAVLGIALAVVLGKLVYHRSVHLNLATFFKVTGIALIIIAAGVLAYGVHDLQEAGVLPGLNSLAFDVSKQIPPSSWYGTVLKGTLNFSPATTWLELIAYVAYLVPVMWLFVRRPGATRRRTPPVSSTDVANSATVAAPAEASPSALAH